MFRPSVQQFSTSIRVRNHILSTDANGVPVLSYQDADPALDFCNWKGKGGAQEDTLVVTDTAEVTMWYRPDINTQDRILLNDNEDEAYVVLNVENIEQRNMYLVLKVKREVSQFPQIAQILPCTGYGRYEPIYGASIETKCRFEKKSSSGDAKAFFPLGTLIRKDDRLIYGGKEYLVEHISEDQDLLRQTAHIEVSLRGL